MPDPAPRQDGFSFADIVRAGDVVAWPQATGEPLGLSAALVTQLPDLPPLGLFIGMSSSRTLAPPGAERLVIRALNGAGNNRALAASGALDVIPAHVSAVPELLRSGAIKVDVVLLRVRPSAKAGFVTTGVVADFTQALVAAARCVVAECDHRLPLTGQDALVPTSAIHHFVAATGPEPLMPDPEPSAVDCAVARQVAALVPDGATVQLGIGSLPVAVARAMAQHRDLGVHTGSASDVLVDMVEAGIVTNSRKGIDPGVSVSGCLFGTRRLYDFADGNAALSMRSADYTHAIATLGRIVALHSINSAIEVDLTGQVNAEQAGSRYLGAVGGQVDFVRGALASPGGRSIIALPSTTSDGRHSRIVASLGGRPVTTSRADVDWVVTEWGSASLRGCPLSERARRLAAIAHPDFREDLRRGCEPPMAQAAQAAE